MAASEEALTQYTRTPCGCEQATTKEETPMNCRVHLIQCMPSTRGLSWARRASSLPNVRLTLNRKFAAITAGKTIPKLPAPVSVRSTNHRMPPSARPGARAATSCRTLGNHERRVPPRFGTAVQRGQYARSACGQTPTHPLTFALGTWLLEATGAAHATSARFKARKNASSNSSSVAGAPESLPAESLGVNRDSRICCCAKAADARTVTAESGSSAPRTSSAAPPSTSHQSSAAACCAHASASAALLSPRAPPTPRSSAASPRGHHPRGVGRRQKAAC
eukprot:scaffold2804_cov371-Prasinococcus_capsulatus_cf.AAC.7